LLARAGPYWRVLARAGIAPCITPGVIPGLTGNL
jgi:hypothetical protein